MIITDTFNCINYYLVYTLSMQAMNIPPFFCNDDCLLWSVSSSVLSPPGRQNWDRKGGGGCRQILIATQQCNTETLMVKYGAIAKRICGCCNSSPPHPINSVRFGSQWSARIDNNTTINSIRTHIISCPGLQVPPSRIPTPNADLNLHCVCITSGPQ